MIEPLGEAKPNLEVFRLMARRCGFTDPCFDDTELDIMRQALDTPSEFLAGIDLEKLMSGEPVRVNVPAEADPFAGGFYTPSGKLEFYSERMANLGLDPLPGYHACTESPGERDAARPLSLAASGAALSSLSELRIWRGGRAAAPHGPAVGQDSSGGRRPAKIASGDPVADVERLAAIATTTPRSPRTRVKG